tara:strand:- start:714 stop:932 length:219 start_codon:yes stop_codon:yes gene_type:complete
MRNAKIKEEQQLEFFNAVTIMSRDETLDYCTDLIQTARAPNYTLINQLKSMGKDRMIIAMNNFIMKGQGRGV